MEGNPWLRRYRPKINIDCTGITEIAKSLKSKQKMTLLYSEGPLGTARR